MKILKDMFFVFSLVVFMPVSVLIEWYYWTVKKDIEEKQRQECK